MALASTAKRCLPFKTSSELALCPPQVVASNFVTSHIESGASDGLGSPRLDPAPEQIVKQTERECNLQ
jgi:hypothetical protein